MSETGTVVALLIPLAVASAIGLVLGLERELSHKLAGLRTQVLVTVGTALFFLAGKSLGTDGAGKIAANVVTGLGFLGAGVIVRERGTVRGLTTAALIWVNGALGLAAALENYFLAAAGTVVVLLALRTLGAVEQRMATKCSVHQYQVTARENEELVGAVHDALSRGHTQEGPLSFDRQDGRFLMRFAFCNSHSEHQQFAERLRKMSDVLDLKVQ
ncbi:MAG: MgtC/SapB family protein [Candidatus Binatia bacterium]